MGKPAASPRSRVVLGTISAAVLLWAALGMAVATHRPAAWLAAAAQAVHQAPDVTAAPHPIVVHPPRPRVEAVDLVVTPEPSSLVVVAFGALFLLRPRRRA